MKKTILVTGGNGLVGNGIKSFIERDKNNLEDSFNFVFLNSKDCDLRDLNQTRNIFLKYKPNYVIHLAAHVGGLFSNMNYPVEFYRDNILMNDNMMELCRQFNIDKLISCLSTCIFPDKTTYPIDETMIHNSAPHSSNEAYAYAKRMIDVMSRAYNKEYHCNFTSIIPTNIYGKYDNFNIENGHVIPSLIHKAYIANKNNDNFVIYGSGKPLRQFIYSEDLGELIIYILKNYQSCEPIILSVDEISEISIKDLAFMIADEFNIDKRKVIFDTTKSDGQYKKTASNKKLMELLPNYKFKSLKEGINETCKWFKENYDISRK
jgi:GDP-L-fucose synthase